MNVQPYCISNSIISQHIIPIFNMKITKNISLNNNAHTISC